MTWLAVVRSSTARARVDRASTCRALVVFLCASMLVLTSCGLSSRLRGRPSPPPESSPRPTQMEPEEGAATPVFADSVAEFFQARQDSTRAALVAAGRRWQDSLRTAVRDSFTALTRAREDSLRGALRDSIYASERARLDAMNVAYQDSMTAELIIYQDSIAAMLAVYEDSMTAGLIVRQDSIAAVLRDSLYFVLRDSVMTAAGAGIEELQAEGPAYTPFDTGPRMVFDDDVEAEIAGELLAVIRRSRLDPGTQATYWLLVRTDGLVEEAVLHSSSGNTVFDAAALRVANGLVFAPARRDGLAVPVWTLRVISLLMR